MEQQKTGRLIRQLRNEIGLTQQQLAEKIHVSDKTISKWECGQGFPDVSLLQDLADVLGVNSDKLLAGNLEPSPIRGGNMRKIKFYVCPECGNIITATVGADVSCCGRRLEPLEVHKPDAAHQLKFEEVEDEYYITFDHEMTKSHYLNFVAWVGIDRVMLVHLYPEQSGELRMPKFRNGCYYFGCNEHGLFRCEKK